MANRFWGNAPIAEYSPMSMQEMMFAPQELYKRDKTAQAEMDALNDAKMTLQGALGEAAPKQDEFNTKYADISSRIQKEGATTRNLEDAKELKRLYAQNVLPMQEFAKKREAYATEYAKARMNGDNLVMGDNPLVKSYDEWRSNPNVFEFKTVDKKDLTNLGAIYGKNIAEGMTGKDLSMMNYGKIGIKKGFMNSEEAHNAFNSDPKFKKQVLESADIVAKSKGLDIKNPEVYDAVVGGIMSSVVGGVSYESIPDRILQGMSEKSGVIQDGPSLLDYDTTSTFSPYNTKMILSTPAFKDAADKASMQLYGKSFKELTADIDSLMKTESESQLPSIPLAGEWTNPIWKSTLDKSDKRTDKLIAIKNEIESSLGKNAALQTDIVIDPNHPSIAGLPAEKRTMLKEMKTGVESELDNLIGSVVDKSMQKGDMFGTEESKQNEYIKEYMKALPQDKNINFEAININPTTGRSVIKARLSWKAGKNQEDQSQVIGIHVPQNAMENSTMKYIRTLGAINQYDKENTDRLAASMNRWYKQVEDYEKLQQTK